MKKSLGAAWRRGPYWTMWRRSKPWIHNVLQTGPIPQETPSANTLHFIAYDNRRAVISLQESTQRCVQLNEVSLAYLFFICSDTLRSIASNLRSKGLLTWLFP